MRTDPKQHDYVCEHGASRNYEAWRDLRHAEMIIEKQKQLNPDGDKMENLEKKQHDNQREMVILDALEECR